MEQCLTYLRYPVPVYPARLLLAASTDPLDHLPPGHRVSPAQLGHVQLLGGVDPVLGVVNDVVIVLSCSVTPPVGRLVPVRPERSLSFPVVILLEISDAAPPEPHLTVQHSLGLQQSPAQLAGLLHRPDRLARREAQHIAPTSLEGQAA